MLLLTTLFPFLATLATASNLTPHKETLQPWTIDDLGAGSPSGRPGSYPWSTITIYNLTDPNTLLLSNSTSPTPVTLNPVTAATCQAKWFKSTSPFSHIWPCDIIGSGYFTLEILQTPDYTLSNFQVRITRVAETIAQGMLYSKKYSVTATFKKPDQLDGTCGGSGVCSWGLREELSPYPLVQSEVS